ncbi:MAG: hypothetical protein K9M07_01705 [Simkaniaceae bacterium]|nr:hypothetical protein [Simkaniaceae bacterium]
MSLQRVSLIGDSQAKYPSQAAVRHKIFEWLPKIYLALFLNPNPWTYRRNRVIFQELSNPDQEKFLSLFHRK